MIHRKNKNGFVFAIVPLLYMFGGIVLLGLLVWFGFKINEGLVAVFSFLKQWWWAIGLTLLGFMWFPQLKAIVNAILGRLGIKV